MFMINLDRFTFYNFCVVTYRSYVTGLPYENAGAPSAMILGFE